jgi:hypothetical protein
MMLDQSHLQMGRLIYVGGDSSTEEEKLIYGGEDSSTGGGDSSAEGETHLRRGRLIY